jgi:hypothetical protein
MRRHSKLTGDCAIRGWAHSYRRQRCQLGLVELAGAGREIDRGDVHPLGQRLVDQVDDELAAVADVALGVLVAVAAPRAGLIPSTTTVGTELTALKKLNGAALTRPALSTVVASAIGRGTTVLTSSS